MTRLTCSISLIAALAATPREARANPTAVTALRTLAVASEPGVAEALPPASSDTTKVEVTVTRPPSPTPPAPVVTPPPPKPELPTAQQRYEQELRSQIRHDRKAGRGLLTAGLMVAGTSYLFTSLAGAVTIDKARDLTDDPATPDTDEGRRGDRRREFGRALLIPGVGPALAIARSDSAVRSWGAGVAGLTQALGAGLAIIGIHRLARARRLDRLSLTAVGTSRQAHVSLRVRF